MMVMIGRRKWAVLARGERLVAALERLAKKVLEL